MVRTHRETSPGLRDIAARLNETAREKNAGEKGARALRRRSGRIVIPTPTRSIFSATPSASLSLVPSYREQLPANPLDSENSNLALWDASPMLNRARLSRSAGDHRLLSSIAGVINAPQIVRGLVGLPGCKWLDWRRLRFGFRGGFHGAGTPRCFFGEMRENYTRNFQNTFLLYRTKYRKFESIIGTTQHGCISGFLNVSKLDERKKAREDQPLIPSVPPLAEKPHHPGYLRKLPNLTGTIVLREYAGPRPLTLPPRHASPKFRSYPPASTVKT
ncbi:hypothetical protein K0M31_009184 [Melipona bicolor]|uniref:Uncharacterized protein n=1 Tax=Melipona bicolor TaxID=60889 RepID=A0AA40FP36_9HYME|nr:hypothetical protein K0M31_009184 [Melipona bicolor]